MILSRKQFGFTLVEVIIVIAIMGIIGGLSSMIIGRSLDSYAALERREKLQTSIRLAVERMSREVRHALPNSICVSNGTKCAGGASGSGTQFYFIPVKDSGRYQDKPGTYSNPVAPPPVQHDPLLNHPPGSSQFDVLSTNSTNHLLSSDGDWVVVHNTNNNDVYTGVNDVRKQITTIGTKDIDNDGVDDIDQVQLSGGNQVFASHSLAKRFHIIQDDTVTLFSLQNNALYRETTSFANPHVLTGGGRRLLLENVETCLFTYQAGSLARAGLLRINITVLNQGERIQVIHDAHVYNTP